jgi:hypothetical protein
LASFRRAIRGAISSDPAIAALIKDAGVMLRLI